MAHRTFRDQDGRLWEVWAAFPDPSSPGAPPTPPIGQEVALADVAITVPQHLRSGWLVFVCESTRERRRYAPVPVGWELSSRETLRIYLDTATQVTRF